jgi:hypothetical protein
MVMILYINTPLKFSLTNPPDPTEDLLNEQLDIYFELESIFDSYGMHYLLNNREDGLFLTIYPQKIVLDDIDMNTLIYTIDTSFYDPVLIKYSAQGGKGCEFAIELLQGDISCTG